MSSDAASMGNVPAAPASARAAARQQKRKNRLDSSRVRLFLSENGRSGMDIPFLISVLLLLAFGLVMLYSVSYAVAYYRYNDSAYFIKRQVIFAVLGLTAMLLVSRLDYHILRKLVWIAYFASILLLIIALFMPEINYCHRWIVLFGGRFQFQPSEIAKLSLILAFAHLGSRNQAQAKTFRYGVLPYMVLLLPVVVLMVLEPHLSGTILMIALAAILMFSSGTSIKWFAIAFGAVAALLVVALVVKPDLVPVAQDRINIWQHPELDPTGDGMQTLQGMMAIGSGGLTGLGLGNSRQKYMYVPEPYNDAIFTIVCEELGFVGAVLIIIMFAFLLIRGMHVALHAKDRFGALLVTGVVAQVILQAVLNIMVVTNTIPYTGITLPFFSYGGTALSMLLAEMGLVLSVSRQANIQR